MNENIEVVNENLWCVNQYHVQAGFIKELTLLPGTTPGQGNLSDRSGDFGFEYRCPGV